MRHFPLPMLLLCLTSAVLAQSGPVIVAGTLQDEASKAGVLAKLRAIYGRDNVIDQITVAAVATPPNWNNYVDRLITPDLRQVRHGQLGINGNTVSLTGEVASEALRQKITAHAQNTLNATFTTSYALRVVASDQQALDATLADRIVEFDSGKATLTPLGRAILDDMAAAMLPLKDRRVNLVGHTDNQGPRAANQILSQARAEAVKSYLSARGINRDMMAATGMGAEHPVASNDNAEGRARNRRIEFRLAP